MKKFYARWCAVVVMAGLLGVIGLRDAEAQQNTTPIRFGINTSMTGFLAPSITPTMAADKIWEKEVNARGGLLGRKVELTFVDNKSSAENAVAIYERMLQANHDFIFENSGSIVLQRESTLAEQHHKLFLVPGGFAKALYQRGYKYIFFTGSAVAEDLNIGIVRLFQSLPVASRPKTIAYVTLENIANASVTKGTQEMMKPLNMTTVVDITYPPNVNDATPLVSNLKEKNPDVVFQTGFVNDTILFARAVEQQELRSKVLAIGMTAGAQPNFLPTVGDRAAEGMVYSVGWWDMSLKTFQNQEFIRAYQKEMGFDPIYNAAHGYARWQILEQAVNATKSLDQDVLRDYIASHSFQTLLGTIKYNADGYMTPEDTIVMQFQNGKRVIVWPKQYATGSFIYPKPSR